MLATPGDYHVKQTKMLIVSISLRGESFVFCLGDFHMKQTGMLVVNFELDPGLKETNLGVAQPFCDP